MPLKTPMIAATARSLKTVTRLNNFLQPGYRVYAPPGNIPYVGIAFNAKIAKA